MMRLMMSVLLASLAPALAGAQTPAAAVGPSVSSPTNPTGNTPPGTASAATPAGQVTRDAAGQQVIGHTAASSGGLPGNTGGAATGTK